MRTLVWNADSEGVTFRVDTPDGLCPVDEWAVAAPVTPDGTAAHVGALLRLISDEQCEIADGVVRVPNDVIADMTPATLVGLGLPPPLPYSIELSKQGLIADVTFAVQLRFVAGGGRPVVGATRTGVIVRVGAREYTLLQPLYGVAVAVEAVNAAHDREARFEAIGQLQERLPDDAVVDAHLRETRVVRADAFTLRPYRAADGSVQFDPVPLRRVRAADVLGPDRETEPLAVLPEARQENWARYLRQRGARATLPAGQGYYLAVSPILQRALEVVTELQRAPAEERAAFARNPQVFLKERLAGIAEGELETVFSEAGSYGERVRDIGLWQPKVLPIVRGGANSWLPPETMGLRIGDETITFSAERATELLAMLEQAKEQGLTDVEFEGRRIPVSQESIDAARALVRDASKDLAISDTGAEGDPSHDRRLTVLIADNINETTYVRKRRAVEGTVGDLPAGLRTALFPFQLEGYRWLQELWTAGAPGGVLADDMGLGKTLQTLAFLKWVRERSAMSTSGRPILIVGPTGLLRNWAAEHEQHLEAPGLGTMIEAHGPQLASLRVAGDRGSELRTGLPSLDLERLRDADWVLTTYENLRDYQHSFAKLPWRVVVLDEAQRIKNPAVMTTDAAKALRADFVVALTGTPVENHLADLWSIADTAQPGVLGSLQEFASRYQPDSTFDSARLKELSQRIQVDNPPPLMLRRLKQDHVEGLPELSVHVERVQMPERQAQRYAAAVEQGRASNLDQGGMLGVLQMLRSVSLHPDVEKTASDDEFVRSSARLAYTIKTLDLIAAAGEKALVFVEALAMQDALTAVLQRRYGLRRPPLVINGSVAGSNRKSRVDEFQNTAGFDVMLLSPRAGGVGLTITAANHVIHLSRWWNPAVEDQATDRVYRIGQTKPVHVYLPLAIHSEFGDNSFDQRLHELLERKRALSRNVLTPAPATTSDLRDLFQAAVGQRAGGPAAV